MVGGEKQSHAITMSITIAKLRRASMPTLLKRKWPSGKTRIQRWRNFETHNISSSSAVLRSTGLDGRCFPVAPQSCCASSVCAFTKSAGGFVVSVAWLKGVYPDAVNHGGSAALLITGQTRRRQAHMVHTYGLCMLRPRPSLDEVGCCEEWVVAWVYFQGVHPDSQRVSNTQHTFTLKSDLF